METSKEDMYNVNYTSILRRKGRNKKKWTSKLKKIFRKNKIISISIFVFIICVMMNWVLIYNFLKILQQV